MVVQIESASGGPKEEETSELERLVHAFVSNIDPTHPGLSKGKLAKPITERALLETSYEDYLGTVLASDHVGTAVDTHIQGHDEGRALHTKTGWDRGEVCRRADVKSRHEKKKEKKKDMFSHPIKMHEPSPLGLHGHHRTSSCALWTTLRMSVEHECLGLEALRAGRKPWRFV